MSRKNAIRIVVGTDFGPRSNVWRIWTQNNELYVAGRSVAHELKTSLHSSGIYRHAFTGTAKPTYIANPDADRVLFRWTQPPLAEPGFRWLLEILMPTAELTIPKSEPPESEKTKPQLIDPAPDGHATVLTIVETAPNLEVDGFPRPEGNPPAALVHKWTLPDQRTIWVVASHQPLSDEFWAMVADARTQMQQQLSASNVEPTGEHLRLMFTTHVDDMSLVRFLDLAP
jgi:hypothetical protein